MLSLVRRLGILVGITVVIIVLLLAKVKHEGQQTWTQGEAAFSQGAYQSAVVSYERTIKWYTPGSTTVPQALARLWQIGQEAEERQDHPLAMAAYSAIRSGLYAVQSFYVPYAAWIPKSEERLAVLMAQTKLQTVAASSALTQETKRFAAMFPQRTKPHTGWSIVLELAFLGWVGATVGLIWYGFPAQGSMVWSRSGLWGGLLALCFSLWVLAMVQA